MGMFRKTWHIGILCLFVPCVLSAAPSKQLSEPLELNWVQAPAFQGQSFTGCKAAQTAFQKTPLANHRVTQLEQWAKNIYTDTCFDLMDQALNDSDYFVRRAARTLLISAPRPVQKHALDRLLFTQSRPLFQQGLKTLQDFPTQDQRRLASLIPELLSVKPHHKFRKELYAHLLHQAPEDLVSMGLNSHIRVREEIKTFLRNYTPDRAEAQRILGQIIEKKTAALSPKDKPLMETEDKKFRIGF